MAQPQLAQFFSSEECSKNFNRKLWRNDEESLAVYRNPTFVRENFEGLHMRDKKKYCWVLKQDLQQGRSE